MPTHEPEHHCDTGHFDRTICPEPCGTMHSFCSTCGKRQDACAHEPEGVGRGLSAEEREAVHFAVAHWHPDYDEGSRLYEVVARIAAAHYAQGQQDAAEEHPSAGSGHDTATNAEQQWAYWQKRAERAEAEVSRLRAQVAACEALAEGAS